MNNLYVMVGCPGSGKSYYLDKNVDKDNALIVSRDEIRFSLLSDNDDYFAKERKVFKKFRNKIQEGLDSGRDVYADATHINGISRLKLLNSLNLDNINIIPIVVKSSLDNCIERNSKREGRARIPEDALISSYNKFVDPKEDNWGYTYSDIVYINGDI